jgi:hypothetical protein
MFDSKLSIKIKTKHDFCHRAFKQSKFACFEPYQGIAYGEVPDHFIFSGRMVKGLPGTEQGSIVECNGTKNQKGLCYRPILPIHDILLKSPSALVSYKGIHKSDALTD